MPPAPTVLTASELENLKSRVFESRTSSQAGPALPARPKPPRKMLPEAQALQKELEEKERKQLELDFMEEQVRFEKRRDAILAANAKLAAQESRVREIARAQLFSDCLKEREQQIAVKRVMARLEHARDEMYDREILNATLGEQADETPAVLAKSRIPKDQYAKILEKQMDEKLNGRIQEREREYEEAELLHAKAQEDLLMDYEKYQESRARNFQVIAEQNRINEYIAKCKDFEYQRERREEKRREKYADEKQRLIDLRRAKEKELFDKKQSIRQAMIDKQTEQLAQQKANEKQRVDEEVQLKDDRDRAELAAKQEKMRKWKADIQHSRKLQLSRKQRERDLAMAEEKRAVEIQQAMFTKMEEDEQNEILERRGLCQQIEKEQFVQIDIKKRQKLHEKELEKQTVKRAINLIKQEELRFQNHAESIIKEYAIQGKNVIPIIKELRNVAGKSNKLAK
jgi:Trichohyalin-plectin-homology domain